MTGIHKSILLGIVMIVSGSIFVAGVIALSASAFSGLFSGEEAPKVVASSPLKVEIGEEPKQPEPEPEKRIQRSEPPQVRTVKSGGTPAPKKPSLRDKWLARVNEGGMYAFGNDNGYSGVHSEGGDCQITQPVRVRAMIADSSSTDTPGMAIGAISEDVQGTFPDGEWCVAIHAMSVVSFNVDKAGDYATNRAPVTVGNIWMQDGFSISVNQPAKHIDGSIGVIGKANHHTFSKTIAAIAGGTFRLLDNVTSFGQYNMSSGDVTGPFEKKIDKRLNRPSEITFTGGKVVEFDVMPVSTPGY